MFKVTEDIHHGDYRRASVGVGRTVNSALVNVLKHSPYNSNMNQDKKQALSNALADRKTGYHGWADYACEYRSDLTGCEVIHVAGGSPQPALVLSDEGDTLLVIEYPEGEAPPEGKEQEGMPRERINTTKVQDFSLRLDH